MSKYVKAYDQVVDQEFCDHLIDKFHANRTLWEEHNNELFTFNQINLVRNSDVFSEEIMHLSGIFSGMVSRYAEDCGLLKFQFPETYGLEEFRMKHYPADRGEFKPHVDANDVESMRRFLVFFLYLDEGEGGGTALYDQNIKVERKAGRMLMFPPTWTYPHAGLMPVGNDKHIIGSYLHYYK